RIRRRRNPSLLLNPLIIKDFFIQAAPEVARIIEPFEQPSTTFLTIRFEKDHVLRQSSSPCSIL
ncbi:hypothetical protein, partial [Pseudomonas indica]|uniref:hypothetical protein n=1 Tax=Pseudomonas indica TaxID=137658 RepID=UPI0023F824B6